jgi:hypothetical protein
MKIGKYDFNSKIHFLDILEILNNTKISFDVVELGFLVLTDAIFDNQGNTINEPIFSDKFSVDFIFNDNIIEPEYLVPFKITPKENYKHSIQGVDFEQNKF